MCKLVVYFIDCSERRHQGRNQPRYIRDAGPELVGLEGEEFLPLACQETYPQICDITIDLHVRNIMAANYSFLKYWQCNIMAANYIAYKWGLNKSYSPKWGPKWKYSPKWKMSMKS